MNISKFLLIDAVLVIAAIPLLFVVSDGKRKSPLLRSSSQEELLRKASCKLPDKEKLTELEKFAITARLYVEKTPLSLFAISDYSEK